MKFFIQAHPKRADLAEGLLDCLGEGEIIYDPDPGHRPSTWRTYELCLRTGIAAGEPFLIIQEDTIVCGNFTAGVEAAMSVQPDNPVAFFVPGRPPAYTNVMWRAREVGNPFGELPLGTWCPVVATAWPVHVAEAVLNWRATHAQPSGWYADDEIIGRALHALNVPCRCSVPSLVEHPDTEPSVMNTRAGNGNGLDPNRRAYYFIGDSPEFQCDALTIDWTAAASR